MGEDVKNKADYAYGLIKERILSFEFQPGKALREMELSEMFDISRTPIRAAVAQLISEGFIEEKGPKTNIVADVSIEKFMNIYKVRECLELLAANGAAYGWESRTEIQRLHEIVDSQAEMMSKETVDAVEFLAEDRNFHTGIAVMSRNRLLAAELSKVYDLFWRYNYYSLYSNHSSMIVQDHMDIINAIEHHNGRLAQEFMKNHLTSTKDIILLGVSKGFDPSRLVNVAEGYVMRHKTKDTDKTV